MINERLKQRSAPDWESPRDASLRKGLWNLARRVCGVCVCVCVTVAARAGGKGAAVQVRLPRQVEARGRVASFSQRAEESQRGGWCCN